MFASKIGGFVTASGGFVSFAYFAAPAAAILVTEETLPMKKLFVVITLFATIGAQAATRQATRPANADRTSNRRAVPLPAPAPATQKPARVATTEDSGGCFSCYWNAGLVQPLTLEEDVKFTMCRAKYCH
jgi:hypothetical protein